MVRRGSWQRLGAILVAVASLALGLALPLEAAEFSFAPLVTSETGVELREVSINNLGDVAYLSRDETQTIFYYDNGVSTPIAACPEADEFSGPGLNDWGQMVWSHMKWDTETMVYTPTLYLYSGGTTTAIATGPEGSMFSTPSINNAGEIAWTETYWSGSTSNVSVYWYEGGDYGPIYTSDNWLSGPDINNEGQIVWTGGTNTGVQLYLWDEGVVSSVHTFSPTKHVMDPTINDNGQIAFTSMVWNNGSPHQTIYLYDDSQFKAVRESTATTFLGDPDLNRYGELVYAQTPWNGNGAAPDQHSYIIEGTSSYEAFGQYQLRNGKVYVGFAHISIDLSYFYYFPQENPSAYQLMVMAPSQRGVGYDDYFFLCTNYAGQTYVGIGHDDYANGTGYFAGFPQTNPQAVFFGQYNWVSGNTFQYVEVYPNGKTYTGQGVAADPTGYFFGVPSGAGAFVLGVYSNSSERLFDVLMGNFWCNVIGGCLLDYQYGG